MAFIYSRKIPLRTIEYARIVIVGLFVTSSMVVISFHMSSRNFLPQMRGSSLKNCDTGLVERKRSSFEVKSGSGSGVTRSFRAAKIPSLPELKSLRNTLDKVITIIEEESGETPKHNAAKEKEPRGVSFSKGSSQDRRIFPSDKRLKTRVSNFFISMDKNFTKYYNGTFVRALAEGKTLPNVRDAVYMNITRLKPAEAVPLHPLSQQDPFKTRMLGLQESCHRYPNGDFSHYIDLKRLVRDDDHRTLMCVVPKAACTTWKSIMYYLSGNSQLEEAFFVKKSDLVIDFGNMKSMAKLSRRGILGRINNFTKFMVTRHPFHRLVSAFRSKFERREPSYVMTHGRKIAQRILQEYLEGYLVKYTKQKKGDVLTRITKLPMFHKLNYNSQLKVMKIASRGYHGNITFEEFLRYGVAINAEKVLHFDVHWRPQHLLCNPCAINYDFVIRFEDLERESNMLLDYIQRNDPAEGRIKVSGESPAAVTDSVAKKFFENISSDLKEEIRQIYEKDFQYFNYDPDNF